MVLTKSEQIRIGLQKSFQSGKSAKASTACYGYRVTPSGDLLVDSAEAKIVAFIFERFSKGDSLGKISDALDRMGINSPTGKEVWSREAISKLLANEKYTGDVILGKTQVVDGVQVKSHDVDKQVLMKGHHPAIISHELFCALGHAHCQEDSSSKQRIPLPSREDSEFMLTLICARAQDESESKSADIKWGIQKSFANPDSKYHQRKCYGYRHGKDGKLVINEKEAEVVRMIFHMADEDASLSQIVQAPQEQDIPSPRGKAIWSRETLRKILHNEKYHGTVVLQKTFVANCLDHKQIKNIGQREQSVIAENHEEPRTKSNKLYHIPVFYLLFGDGNAGNFILRRMKHENSIRVSSDLRWCS